MLKQAFDVAKRALSLTRDVEDCQERIGKLQVRVEQLEDSLREVIFEIRRLRENQAQEHEKLILRLKNGASPLRPTLTTASAGDPPRLTE